MTSDKFNGSENWKNFWVESPDSQRIADELNSTHANFCRHGRNPCFLRCGVQRDFDWTPIAAARRKAWYDNMDNQ